MLEIKKTKPTIGISTFKTLSFFDFQLFYLRKKNSKNLQKFAKNKGEVKIGHHKIVMSAYIGQHRISGVGGSKNSQKRRTLLMDDPLGKENPCTAYIFLLVS